jgi:hypothetical protein
MPRRRDRDETERPGEILSELQLQQGYTCESTSSTTLGDPNGCSAESKLRQPPRPNACDEAKAESLIPTPSPGPVCTIVKPEARWNNNCRDGCDNDQDGQTDFDDQDCIASPVLVDVAGDGFRLTDAAGGVDFDIDGDGARERLSWTAAGSDDAWFVLDRDGSGAIDNGQELFGNFTEQPDPPAGQKRNGFLALAEFDEPANGGNSDGSVDSGDTVFYGLRLWRDVNHNGVSEADELKSLPQSGLAAVSIDYRESRRRDRHGNEFRYRAKVYDAAGADLGRWAYDLFLLTDP